MTVTPSMSRTTSPIGTSCASKRATLSGVRDLINQSYSIAVDSCNDRRSNSSGQSPTITRSFSFRVRQSIRWPMLWRHVARYMPAIPARAGPVASRRYTQLERGAIRRRAIGGTCRKNLSVTTGSHAPITCLGRARPSSQSFVAGFWRVVPLYCTNEHWRKRIAPYSVDKSSHAIANRTNRYTRAPRHEHWGYSCPARGDTTSSRTTRDR